MACEVEDSCRACHSMTEVRMCVMECTSAHVTGLRHRGRSTSMITLPCMPCGTLH